MIGTSLEEEIKEKTPFGIADSKEDREKYLENFIKLMISLGVTNEKLYRKDCLEFKLRDQIGNRVIIIKNFADKAYKKLKKGELSLEDFKSLYEEIEGLASNYKRLTELGDLEEADAFKKEWIKIYDDVLTPTIALFQEDMNRKKRFIDYGSSLRQEDAHFMANKRLMRAVFSNLLGNQIQHGYEGSRDREENEWRRITLGVENHDNHGKAPHYQFNVWGEGP